MSTATRRPAADAGIGPRPRRAQALLALAVVVPLALALATTAADHTMVPDPTPWGPISVGWPPALAGALAALWCRRRPRLWIWPVRYAAGGAALVTAQQWYGVGAALGLGGQGVYAAVVVVLLGEVLGRQAVRTFPEGPLGSLAAAGFEVGVPLRGRHGSLHVGGVLRLVVRREGSEYRRYLRARDVTVTPGVLRSPHPVVTPETGAAPPGRAVRIVDAGAGTQWLVPVLDPWEVVCAVQAAGRRTAGPPLLPWPRTIRLGSLREQRARRMTPLVIPLMLVLGGISVGLAVTTGDPAYLLGALFYAGIVLVPLALLVVAVAVAVVVVVVVVVMIVFNMVFRPGHRRALARWRDPRYGTVRLPTRAPPPRADPSRPEPSPIAEPAGWEPLAAEPPAG